MRVRSFVAPMMALVASAACAADLTGSVLDESGKPIANARVYYGSGKMQETTTGPDGSFRITLPTPAPRELSISVTAPGKVLQFLGSVASDSPPLKVTLKQASVVRGRILGMDGKPCGNIQVHLTSAASAVALGSSYKMTDAEGNFAFEHLAAGKYQLFVPGTIDKGILQPRNITATPEKGQDLGALALVPGVLLRGRVLEKDSGTGVEGITVSVTGPQIIAVQGTALLSKSATTDKQGGWTMRVLPGDLRLLLDPGYPRKLEVPSEPVSLSVPEASTFEVPSQFLAPVPVIRLKVTNEKGEALSGIPLHTSITNTYGPWTNVTDGEGRWSSEGYTGSDIRSDQELYIATPEKWDILSPEKITPPFPKSEVTVVVRPNQPVTGRLIDVEGRPVIDVSVRSYVYPQGKSRYQGRYVEMRTDNRGEYRIPERVRLKEEVALMVYNVGGSVIRMGEQKSGSARLSDTVIERFDSKAQGKVVDGSGKPVAGALVWNALSQTSVRTGPDGTFALVNFPQRGGWIGAGKGSLFGKVNAEPDASKLVITLAPPEPGHSIDQPEKQAQALIAQVRALAAPGIGVRKGNHNRDMLASIIGLVNPALALVAGQDSAGNRPESITSGVIHALSSTEPEKADPLLRQNIENFSSAKERFDRSAELCNALWATRPELARFWLARALKEGDSVGLDALWQALRNPAFALGGEERTNLIARLEQGGKKTESIALRVAMKPDSADTLLAQLPPNERAGALTQAVSLLAKTTGQGLAPLAERLAQRTPTGLEREEYEAGSALTQAVHKLGPTDPALALKLAEKTKGYYSSTALTLAARVQPDTELKEALLRKQVQTYEGGDRRLSVLTAVELLPTLREQIGDNWDVAALSFAKIDSARARQAAEFAVYQYLNSAYLNEPDMARGLRQSAFIALAAVDPRAALQLVDTLDDAEAKAGGKAWIAAMLLLSPEKRLALARQRLVSVP